MGTARAQDAALWSATAIAQFEYADESSFYDFLLLAQMFIFTLCLPPTRGEPCLSAVSAVRRSIENGTIDVTLWSCGCAVCACMDDLMNALSEPHAPNEVHVHKHYLDNTFVEIEQNGESFPHSYRTFIANILEEYGYQPYLETIKWLRFTRPLPPLPS